jgi:hypothetical protein
VSFDTYSNPARWNGFSDQESSGRWFNEYQPEDRFDAAEEVLEQLAAADHPQQTARKYEVGLLALQEIYKRTNLPYASNSPEEAERLDDGNGMRNALEHAESLAVFAGKVLNPDQHPEISVEEAQNHLSSLRRSAVLEV